MPSDYEAIRADNERRYGTDIGRIGPMLLADRYDDRTHFIFELLQNAEDALAKRGEWDGKRAVEFSLASDALSVTHFGKPFDEDDVRGVCGIGESTKDLTSIGRFGIGFKSVYAFTDSPEVHSGSEHFAIDSFVWPRAIRGSDLPPEETGIRLPFRSNEPTAETQILAGLQRLGPRTLLFLREIEEISWSIAEGPSGLYLRGKPESLGNAARKVTVTGKNKATDGVEEERWLIFSRAVSNQRKDVGRVEIAFALEESTGLVRRITDSPLVVFFPTVLSTNLGFLVQGPYRTTPSRDNVPENDTWNQHLVRETSVLLVDALRELRKLDLLNVSALRSLPLYASRFPEGSRFAPLFAAVREALMKEPLLPRYKGGHIAAQGAKLAGTQDLRDMISPEQLASLFESDHELVWLSEDITVDRTPDVYTYLNFSLGVDAVTPEWLLSRLTEAFLEAQPDEWIDRLYAFLSGQKSLLGRLRRLPLVRLEDGSHVIAYSGNQPQAFLPGNDRTDFPTVRRTVCGSEDALAFLKSLGLGPPDPVDDVIANILPRYDQDHPGVLDPDYQSDIERMLAAFATDSTTQRQKLTSALRRVRFVRAVDAGDGSHRFVHPANAYQATQRLKGLFADAPGVLIVDDSKDYLRGDPIRTLLEAVGCPLYLVPSGVEPSLTREEKADLRRGQGITYEIELSDRTLRGLEPLLATIASLTGNEAFARAKFLWEALCDVQERRGAGAFQGEYRWFYYSERTAVFDASFVRLLNETSWIPGENGVLERPRDVVFELTGWQANPFLLTKIRFKPPVIKELAREAGIEPGVLEILLRYGLTSVEDLMPLLPRNGRKDEGDGVEDTPSIADTLPDLPLDAQAPTSPVPEPPEPTSASSVAGERTGEERSSPASQPSRDGTGAGQAASSGRERKFNSYVALSHADEEESDPDGLGHDERMNLEEKAIELIRSRELGLMRTPPNNPGFDLMKPGPDGQPVKWVEVKAMKGTLQDRPVGISRTQFECAREHGEAFWLYVVERAGAPEEARVVRIQDPAGKAQTFTFDHGWVGVAEGP